MVETTYREQIFEIILNRPEKHNAFDAEMIAQITQAVHATPAEARLVRFRGRGKSFCAGADITYMSQQAQFSEEENREDARRLANMFEAIYNLPQPTVALAHGNVFGGGLGILAACDIALATQNARFCFSEVRLGIIPAIISPYVLRKVQLSFAKRYFISAEVFDAPTAKAAGLISDIFPEDTAEADCIRLCDIIVSQGLQAQKSVKKLLHAYENFEPLSRDQLVQELAKLRASDDARMRMKSFLERSR
ncbi:MAG: enoyl-CoA hydratase-related protein [Turneriella sp.]|nr:enoyl-CoA hydratase-related protein [Leptospiraceae bacterium]MCX7631701.1 enoyl-CoA hydratase-related protein [Turneriella sp.]